MGYFIFNCSHFIYIAIKLFGAMFKVLNQFSLVISFIHAEITPLYWLAETCYGALEILSWATTTTTATVSLLIHQTTFAWCHHRIDVHSNFLCIRFRRICLFICWWYCPIWYTTDFLQISSRSVQHSYKMKEMKWCCHGTEIETYWKHNNYFLHILRGH